MGSCVNSAAREIESKVQFWSILGPIVMACILLIVIVRSAATIALPAVAVAGILVCYKWKWRGLAAAIGALVLTFGLQFSLSQVDDWLWLSILALTIASAFIITALAFDESSHAFEAVEDQSERHKETINQLDERLRVFQEKWLLERQDFHVHIEQLKSEIQARDEAISASEKGVALAREELSASAGQQRGLLQELFEAQQHAHQLEERLAACAYPHDAARTVFVEDPFSAAPPPEQAADANAGVVAQYEAETASLRALLEESEALRRQHLQELQQQTEALIHLKELHEISLRSAASAEEQQAVQQVVAQELNEHIETLSREKQLLESTLVRLQGELEGLLQQEEERTLALESSQETIARVQAALEISQNELEAERAKVRTQQTSAEARERDLTIQVEELTRKWSNISQQVGDWQRKLEDYQQVCDKASKLQGRVDLLNNEKQQLAEELQGIRASLAELEKEHAAALSAAQESAAAALEAAQESAAAALSAAQESAAAAIEAAREAAAAAAVKASLAEEGLASQRAGDLSEANRENRRLHGLYNQLKEQFADKSAVLDATRKELFLVQEQLDALKRESQEFQVYGDDETVKGLCRLLAAAAEEQRSLEQAYGSEIESLHGLISEFMLSAPSWAPSAKS